MLENGDMEETALKSKNETWSFELNLIFYLIFFGLIKACANF